MVQWWSGLGNSTLHSRTFGKNSQERREGLPSRPCTLELSDWSDITILPVSWSINTQYWPFSKCINRNHGLKKKVYVCFSHPELPSVIVFLGYVPFLKLRLVLKLSSEGGEGQWGGGACTATTHTWLTLTLNCLFSVVSGQVWIPCCWRFVVLRETAMKLTGILLLWCWLWLSGEKSYLLVIFILSLFLSRTHLASHWTV